MKATLLVVDEEKLSSGLRQELGWVEHELQAEQARAQRQKDAEAGRRAQAAAERDERARVEEERRIAEEASRKDSGEKTYKITVPAFNTTTATQHGSLDPSQIVILTASDGKGHNGAIPNIFETTAANRAAYAARHGYHSHFLNISAFALHGAHPVWAKLPAIASTFNAFPDAEWIWWLDLDALITTPAIELTAHLLSPEALAARVLTSEKLTKVTPKHAEASETIRTPPSYDPAEINLVMTQDHNGPNAGSFFIRRSAWTRTFMDTWADPLYVAAGWIGQEQDAVVHMLRHHAAARAHVAFVEQALINAYPGAGRGRLVTHFAGCWVKNECKQRWAETLDGIRKTELKEAEMLAAQEGEVKKV
ncbi:galactosyl transferase GMA12/MNN10 family-domain-containing protein [Geopyxis carbonaria]|nr:galactosyl transferase GMA12/MNN10 family-domain-containing protein [Geopyxis carbonaria]